MGQCNQATDRGKWLADVIGNALLGLYFVWRLLSGRL
jgi:hypothetical protein